MRLKRADARRRRVWSSENHVGPLWDQKTNAKAGFRTGGTGPEAITMNLLPN